jgi:hypothetical protein
MCPAIVIVCCVGIYSVNNSPEDVLPTSAVALFGDAATRLGSIVRLREDGNATARRTVRRIGPSESATRLGAQLQPLVAPQLLHL